MNHPAKPNQPHLRAVHVPRGMGDVPGEVVETPDESAESVGAPTAATSSPLATAGTQVSSALARAVAEPIAHAALVVTAGVAGAGVGALTGRTWMAAGAGAGTNLFLLGLGMAVLNKQLSTQLRWAYLVVGLLGGGGAGYALWAGAEGSGRRR